MKKLAAMILAALLAGCIVQVPDSTPTTSRQSASPLTTMSRQSTFTADEQRFFDNACVGGVYVLCAASSAPDEARYLADQAKELIAMMDELALTASCAEIGMMLVIGEESFAQGGYGDYFYPVIAAATLTWSPNGPLQQAAARCDGEF
jgi:hypothetical protein